MVFDIRASAWNVQHRRDDVATLHSIGTPTNCSRTVRWCIPERSAVVLGRAQLATDIDQSNADDLGIEVVRRSSGGGAVLVEPGDLTWVDVFVPVGDLLWRSDVGTAFYWLGETWASVLRDAGYSGVQVHRGAMVTTEWSRRVCFAGLGPGEVTLGGRKLVGISQKRTREGALFQCALLHHFRASRLAALFVYESHAEKAKLVEAMAASTVGISIEQESLERAFVAALPL